MISHFRYVVPSHICEELKNFAQAPGAIERGGLLFGEIYLDQQMIKISKVTGPGPRDVGTVTSWERDAEWANSSISKTWEESGGTCHYLGEWHTHPAENPIPSPKDKRSMKRLASTSTLVIDGLLLLIVGRQTTWSGLWTSQGQSAVNIRWEEAGSEGRQEPLGESSL